MRHTPRPETRATLRDTAWMTHAACATTPHFTELHPDQARTICATCPVITNCYQHGLAVADLTTTLDYSASLIVYGGTTLATLWHTSRSSNPTHPISHNHPMNPYTTPRHDETTPDTQSHQDTIPTRPDPDSGR